MNVSPLATIVVDCVSTASEGVGDNEVVEFESLLVISVGLVVGPISVGLVVGPDTRTTTEAVGLPVGP
jgi:hypothetical protein